MVQLCCGSGDCSAAGVSVPGGLKRDLVYRIPSAKAGGLSAAMLMFQNGTIIPPAKAGPLPLDTGLLKRADCSYTADGEPYTRPADNTQVVSVKSATGPADLDVSKSCTQGWSTSISAGVDIFEIVSASAGFEFSKSVTDSSTFSFSVPSGQTGRVGFTANLRCTKGQRDLTDTDTTIQELSLALTALVIMERHVRLSRTTVKSMVLMPSFCRLSDLKGRVSLGQVI